MTHRGGPRPPGEVQQFYEHTPEESRLTSGAGRLELERTKDIFTRVLPAPPASIVDVGGAAGVYSLWLAELGYEVHLVDASPRLVEVAKSRSAASKRPLASITVGDARSLSQAGASVEAVLVMGPLYHLTEAADRSKALREAARVLRPGGVLAAAAVSRFASALDGVARGLTRDPAFVTIRDRDLVDGQHRNDTGDFNYFTTAYFHRPEDLASEILAAGFEGVGVFGVEGPAWILPDLEQRLEDEAQRLDYLRTARTLEREPAIIGASAHLLGVGTKS